MMRRQARERGQGRNRGPKSLPYTPEQILDEEFHPGPIDER
jgi:hypothetical protein